MNTQFASEQEKLLHDIGVLSFVVIELSLYLDTHPTDQNALKYFNHYNRLAIRQDRSTPPNIRPSQFPVRMFRHVTTGNGHWRLCHGKEAVTNVEL